jgi:glycerophosphoryl diester phosphodiesterase
MLNQSFKPTVLAGAMLAILGFQSAAEAMPQFQMKTTPIVIGHRGTAGHRPDHTIEGYTLAIELGADFIEPDLVLTKDGHMVARHEPMIGGTTDVASHPEFANRKTKRLVDGVEYNDWFATDFTLAEIKTLRAVQPLARRDQQYNGLFQIPTLNEVIALAKSKSKETGRAIGIYPEIKHSTYHANIKDANNHLLFGQNVFENKLLKKLHASFGNSACAPVFIQSFEVSNLQYLSHKTNIQLVQLVDADDVNDDGSISLVAPYKQPYDFVVKGDPRTFADLLTNDGLDFVKSYADAVGPWKTYLVKTVNDGIDRNGDGSITINDRRVDGSTGVVEMAHEKGLLVHTWTFRNDASGYGFTDPEVEMTYYYDLGLDGLFTDYADTGVLARDASINASKVNLNNQCKIDHEHHVHTTHDLHHSK